MTFRKAVGPKTLDLLETVLGKLWIVTPPDHVSDQLVLEISDRPDIAERRHRTAQPIGLLGGESGRLDRDAHRLFLKQRHAERLVQHLVQLVRRTMLRR